MPNVPDSEHIGIEFPTQFEYERNVTLLIRRINKTNSISDKEKSEAIKKLNGITKKQMIEIVNGDKNELKVEAIKSINSLIQEQIQKIKKCRK